MKVLALLFVVACISLFIKNVSSVMVDQKYYYNSEDCSGSYTYLAQPPNACRGNADSFQVIVNSAENATYCWYYENTSCDRDAASQVLCVNATKRTCTYFQPQVSVWLDWTNSGMQLISGWILLLVSVVIVLV